MFDSLALIVVLSFIIPFLSIRFAKGVIPSVAFEIIIGFIIGKSGFNIVQLNSEVLKFFSEFGLLYLMFLGGYEVDFSQMGSKSKKFFYSPLFLSATAFILTFILSYLFSLFLISLFHCSNSPFYLTLIFSTTSVAIVFPILKAREDLKKIYRQTLALSAIIADFTTLFLITVYSILKTNANGFEKIVLISATILVLFIIYKLSGIFTSSEYVEKMSIMLKHKSHIQIGIRGSFAVLFIFLFLAEKLGIEVILGSFVAGMIVSKLQSKESSVMSIKLDAIGYGFFIPFFFIYQGAKSSLPFNTKTGIIFIIVILIGAYLIKMLSSIPFKLRFSFRETVSAGILLSGRLSLVVAASLIGLQLGVVNESVNSAMIILAALSCVISPALFNIIEKPRFHKHKSKIIVVGAGKVGSGIAMRFTEKGKTVVVIEKDKEKCERLKNICLSTIYCGSGEDEQLWEKIKPKHNDTILIVTNNDEVNLRIADILKEKYDIHRLFARDNDPKNRKLFKEKGVISLIYTQQLLKTIEQAIENPSIFEFLDEQEKQIYEKTVKEMDNRPLKEINSSGDFRVLLVKRLDKWFYPEDDFILKKNDRILFISDKKEKFNKIEF